MTTPAPRNGRARRWGAAVALAAIATAAIVWAMWPDRAVDAERSVPPERARMVHDQIASRWFDERDPVADARVVAAMLAVPRAEFVDPAWRDEAHADLPVPSPSGATVSQPYLVARVLEEARVAPGARVLELGTHSGYVSALLLELGARVVSIEGDAARREAAEATIARVRGGRGLAALETRGGDLAAGAPDRAPFDVIIAHVAFPEFPAVLAGQLAPSGRIVVPVGAEGELQDLVVGERGASLDDAITTRSAGGVRYGPYRPASAPAGGAARR